MMLNRYIWLYKYSGGGWREKEQWEGGGSGRGVGLFGMCSVILMYIHIVRFLWKTTMTVAAIFERSNNRGFCWRREKYVYRERLGGGVQSSWVWWLHTCTTIIRVYYIHIHIRRYIRMCLPVVLLLLLLFCGPASSVVEQICRKRRHVRLYNRKL